MKIDFSKELVDLKGKAINLKTEAGDQLLRLSDAVVEAVLGHYNDEGALDGTEKFRRYKLAIRIDGASVVDLEVEEVAKIKQLIAKRWTPLIVGRCYELIEEGRKNDT